MLQSIKCGKYSNELQPNIVPENKQMDISFTGKTVLSHKNCLFFLNIFMLLLMCAKGEKKEEDSR